MTTPLRTFRFALVLATLLAAARPAAAARGDITLLGSMSLPNSVHVSDVWGWVDPATSREYAVVGDWYGRKVYVVDVTDPAEMRIASEVAGVPGFDVKVWDHYVYVCDGDVSGLDSRVIDIANPLQPVLAPRGFYSAHNIAISASGTMFLEFPGLRVLDLAADPLVPALLHEDFGEFRDGHDSTPRGDRLYDFRGREGTLILDVSDPSSPDTLGAVADGSITYHHSGDATADGTTLLINDELAAHPRPDITVWDITDPTAPIRVASIADPNSTVHNLYVVGDLAYVAYYASGFKVIDISDPSSPSVLDRFDTSPLSGEGFVGAFGVYPAMNGARAYVSDIDNGLFVFDVDTTRAAVSPAGRSASRGAALAQNVPNPFNPATTISFELHRASRVELSVYDVRGARVRRLLEGPLAPGPHDTVWNGRDDAGRRVASGVYFYRLETNQGALTRRMVLVK